MNVVKELEEKFNYHYERAREFLKEGDFVSAREEVEKALDVKPGDDRALHLLGMIYFKIDDFEKAVKIFKQILRRNPHINTLRVNLGLTYLKLEEYENAVEILREATRIEEDNEKAHNYLGYALYNLGRYEEALEEFKKGKATKMIQKIEKELKEKIKPEGKEEVTGEVEELPSSEKKVISEESLKDKVEEKISEKIMEKEESRDEKVEEEVIPHFTPISENLESGSHPSSQPEELTQPPAAEAKKIEEVKTPDFSQIKIERIHSVKDGNLNLKLLDNTFYARTRDILLMKGDVKTSPAKKKYKGKDLGIIFGDKEDHISVLSGRGSVVIELINIKNLYEIEVRGEEIFLREDFVFGFNETLEWENGRLAKEEVNLNLVRFSNYGYILLRIEPDLVHKIENDNPEEPVIIPLEKLVGWKGKFLPSLMKEEDKIFISLKGTGIVFLRK